MKYGYILDATQDDIDDGDDLINTASVTATEITEPVTDDAATTITPLPSISVAKDVDQDNISAPATLNYTITVTNTGNVALNNVSVADDLAGTATLTSGDDGDGVLEAGEVWTYTATYDATQTDIDAGTDLVNIASVTTTEITEPVTDDAVTIVERIAAMTIDKVVDIAQISAPATLLYTIEVTNTGNISLTDVVVTDPLTNDNNPLTLATGDDDNDGELDLTETWIYNTSLDVTQDIVNAGDPIINTAYAVTAEITDPEEASATTTIERNSDLDITKTVDQDEISSPTTLNYTIEVTNAGNVSLTGIVVTDPLTDDDPLTLVSGDADNDNELDLTETWIYNSQYIVTQSMIDQGVNLVNIASVISNEVTTPETAQAVTAIDQNPSLTVEKNQTSTDPVTTSGQVIEYEIIVTNTGNISLTGGVATETYPGDGVGTLSEPLESMNADGILEVGETWTHIATYPVTQYDINAGVYLVNTISIVTNEYPGPTQDTAVTPIEGSSLVEITKEAAENSFAAPGDEINYTITVTNSGTVSLTDVLVTDPLTNLNATIPTLDPGQIETFNTPYVVTQADIDAGHVDNTATAYYTYGGEDHEVEAEESVDAIHDHEIVITKDATETSFSAADDVINYTITVTNTGNVTLTDVRVTDPLTGLDQTIASLEPDQTETFITTYTVDQDDVDAGFVDNTAVAAYIYEGVDYDEEADERVNASRNHSVQITKDATETSFSAVGDVINYTITVTNTGNVTLTDVRVTDPLTGLDRTIASLEPDQTETFITTYTVDQDDVDTGYVDNTAVAAYTYEGVDYDEEADERVNASRNHSVTITKDATETSFDTEGDVIHYSIVVTNTGNVTLTDVSVTDQLTGLIHTITSLEPGTGNAVTFTTEHTITLADINRGYVTNTAVAEYTYEGDDFDEEATVTVNGSQDADLSITKDADESGYNDVGDQIHYTIVVTNNGNVTLTNITVTDPLTDLDQTIASLGPGESETITTVYTITQADINNGRVENTATAEYNFGGSPQRVSDSETVSGTQGPDLSITKDVSESGYDSANDVLHYTIVVRNTGNVTLTNIVVTDPLTGLNRTVPTLAPGASVTINTTHNVTQEDINRGFINNTATARFTYAGETYNREDSESISSVMNASWTLTKTATERAFSQIGDVIHYTIAVQNTGNVSISGLVLTDPGANAGSIRYLSGDANGNRTLDPLETWRYAAEHTITLGNLTAGQYTNTATVNGTMPNGNAMRPASDSETVSLNNQPPVIDCPDNITTNTSSTTNYVEIDDDLEAYFSDPNNNIVSVTWVMTGATTGQSAATGINIIDSHRFNQGVTTITYTVTDALGLTDQCSFTVSVADETPPVAVCRDITIYLDLVTGRATIVAGDVDGGSYDNSGYIDRMVIDRNQFDCTNIGPNNVTLTVYDESGNSDWCVSVVTVQYAVDPLPAADPQFQVICDDSPTSLDLTSNIPGTTWTWTVNASPEITGSSDDNSGTLSSISQLLHNSDLSAHYVIYNVIPRVYGRCNLERITAEVWVNPEPEIRVSASDDLICNLGSTVISVTNPHGDVRDQWIYDLSVTADPGIGGFTPSGTYTSPADLTETLTNSNREISSVVYRFTPRIVTSDGTTVCTGAEQSLTIQVYPTLTNYYTKVLSDYNGFNINCFGNSTGSIVINPTTDSPPMTYSWAGPGGFRSSERDISGLVAGDYVLTLTDLVTMCSETETVTLTQPPYPISMTLDISQSTNGGYNISCCGASTGWITVTPLNNIGLVDFMWADGAIGHERTNLPAGPYKVIITDSNNCTAESSVTLTEPTQIVLHFDVVNSTCPGKPDGAVSVDPTGGVPEVPGDIYTYLWSNNSTSQSIENIVEGVYTVNVTDMNACTVTGTATVRSMNEYCLIIPEAFSPNDDGTNDLWRIEDIELYPDVVITIYNRWSQEVWRSDRGYTQPWDGRSNGTMLPVDSYHYVIELNNGIKPIVGHVTIVR